ncbi:asparagine synthase-related protein [Streptomyces castrisilvae]|uniref:Asparagine synthase-related protein n=1 Tax=Streptomyces castrisilvae TaxID=3033811 RepID=A0ABY9HMK4_9ACTN|nr:asparagine synthase-related protein [Streptomyces sp. Mut1]WLQ35546.1 asparagine synthase-related protein [Streptomyces sp. Mut1]
MRVGPDCQVRVLASEQVRIALVGDFLLTTAEESGLLAAVAERRWSDLMALPGSYWVVARAGKHSFVCGDLSGLRSIFYARQPGCIWSTSAQRLAVHQDALPDLPFLAARITAGAEHWPGRTVYDGVHAVPAGFGLLLGGEPVLVDVSGYAPSATLEQGAPVSADALERAVQWRMEEADGLVGADVSGGLDSSTLAILASRAGSIRAVTYADRFTSSEDLDFARRVASHMGTELKVGAGGPKELPFGWSWDQPVPDQPAALSLTCAQHALYLRPAAGLPLHFTGNGGDIVLDSCSAAWIGMVQCGDRRAARRQVTGWARARNRPPRDLWQAVTRAASITHDEALTRAADRVERADFGHRRSGVWSWCHLGQSAKWLTPHGREQVAGMLREAASAATTEARADLAEQRTSLRLVGADARDTVPLTRPWRIRQVHPFLDNQVVRAAFTITPVERHGVTTFKPLLAAALPFLPPWLTGRTSKGSFSRQLTAGMVHHRPALADLIRTSPLATNGLLDAEPALAALARVGGTAAGDLYDLQRLVMTCQWLAARERLLTTPGREAAC